MQCIAVALAIVWVVADRWGAVLVYVRRLAKKGAS
jgi:hypothetical protein